MIYLEPSHKFAKNKFNLMLNSSKLRVYLDIFLSKLSLKCMNDLIFNTIGKLK